MDNQTFILRKIHPNMVLVLSTSYLNPVNFLDEIEKDLCGLDFSGFIVFDLLLSNGISFNRFMIGKVKAGKIIRSTLRICENTENEIINDSKSFSKSFYKENKNFLSDSILSNEERYLILNT